MTDRPFKVHEILILRLPHLKGTEHYESRVNYRGRVNEGESMVSPLPGEGVLDLVVPTEHLSRDPAEDLKLEIEELKHTISVAERNPRNKVVVRILKQRLDELEGDE